MREGESCVRVSFILLRHYSPCLREMICRIQLLLTLTSCVCGTFVMNVTQTSYQAVEGDDITLEWRFPTKNDSSPNSLFIFCEMLTDHKSIHLYRLHGGVEDPESQGEQFAGRVQCDKDVLRQGIIKLHVSRLRTDDSGQYLCEVSTAYGADHSECRLNVTARPKTDNTASRERIGLYCALTAAVTAVLVVFV